MCYVSVCRVRAVSYPTPIKSGEPQEWGSLQLPGPLQKVSYDIALILISNYIYLSLKDFIHFKSITSKCPGSTWGLEGNSPANPIAFELWKDIVQTKPLGPFGVGKVPGRKYIIKYHKPLAVGIWLKPTNICVFLRATFDAPPKECSENMKSFLKHVDLNLSIEITFCIGVLNAFSVLQCVCNGRVCVHKVWNNKTTVQHLNLWEEKGQRKKYFWYISRALLGVAAGWINGHQP